MGRHATSASPVRMPGWPLRLQPWTSLTPRPPARSPRARFFHLEVVAGLVHVLAPVVQQRRTAAGGSDAVLHVYLHPDNMPGGRWAHGFVDWMQSDGGYGPAGRYRRAHTPRWLSKFYNHVGYSSMWYGISPVRYGTAWFDQVGHHPQIIKPRTAQRRLGTCTWPQYLIPNCSARSSLPALRPGLRPTPGTRLGIN